MATKRSGDLMKPTCPSRICTRWVCSLPRRCHVQLVLVPNCVRTSRDCQLSAMGFAFRNSRQTELIFIWSVKTPEQKQTNHFHWALMWLIENDSCPAFVDDFDALHSILIQVAVDERLPCYFPIFLVQIVADDAQSGHARHKSDKCALVTERVLLLLVFVVFIAAVRLIRIGVIIRLVRGLIIFIDCFPRVLKFFQPFFNVIRYASITSYLNSMWA